MNNLEKHQEELTEYLLSGKVFCVTKEGDICSCQALYRLIHSLEPCENCLFKNSPGGCAKARKDWLVEEYTEPEVEPEVDWSKVPVDTPIFVRDTKDDLWLPRYFAKCKDNRVYAWRAGATSWSAYDSKDIASWNFAKLTGE